MLNALVANFQDKSMRKRASKSQLEQFLYAQIENSIDLGWAPEKILLISNFDFSFMGVTSKRFDMNDFCITGSKMFGILKALGAGLITEEVWLHDCDAWQSVYFDCPEFKDVGITTYSTSKYNGGSIFLRPSAIDIVKKVVDNITEEKHSKEEPTLNRILKSDEYKDRVTCLNNTFNVGCSGFVKRYNRSIKPIHVCHLHPNNRIAWETHTLDRNGLGENETSVSKRLEKVIRKYFTGLAEEISEDGRQKQQMRKKENAKKC